MQEPLTPSQSVLDAFNIHQPLQALSGGRGLCFLAGDIVLRPVDDTTEAEWLSDLLFRLCDLSSPEYRVSRPILRCDASVSPPSNRFVASGWTASSFNPGAEGSKHKWNELFDASRAFHRDLKELVREPPAFIWSRTNRWAQADRITWEEQLLEDTPEVNQIVLERISGYLARLEKLKKPLSKDTLICQLIHADLTGNLLFDVEGQGLSPAIIDLSLYWRPVDFAEAIVVADGLMWYGEGRELIRLYGTDSFRLQILIRALYWRILTFAIQSDLPWLELHLPRADFEHAVSLVSESVAGT
jgi:uncharacterized protein (TIGR02569 family)